MMADPAAPRHESFQWKSWTIQTCQSKIYNNDSNSLKKKSHVVWKNELGLTRFSNQDLPEALWGSNLLSLYHTESDTTIYFCAMDALRSWALLDKKPIDHLLGKKPDAWDYTFTTPYAGSVTRGEVVTDTTIQPNGSSLYQSPADNLAKGAVQLRPPLCKCVGGRLLCAGVVRSMEKKKTRGKNGRPLTPTSTLLRQQESTTTPLPVEKWEATNEPFDMEGLLNTETQPAYYTKPISFWVQNLDPHSYSSLMGHALVGNKFLVASLRCFVRVNGVRVRLLETKFIIRGNNEVLRERSWREGTWAEYTGLGEGEGTWIDLGTHLEQGRRAAQRLQHKHPPVVEKLLLKTTPNALSSTIRTTTTTTMTTLWTKVLDDPINGGSTISCSSSRIIALLNSKVVALDSKSGSILWERGLDGGLSVEANSDGRILVGDDQGFVHILQWPRGGEKEYEDKSFSFGGNKLTKPKMRHNNRVQSASMWVERVAWSEDGKYFAAAAGKKVMVNGNITEMEGTVYAISFLRNDQLAVAIYGGFTIINLNTEEQIAPNQQFDVGASAVLTCAVSPDANSIAIGCLDKYVRVFQHNRNDQWSARDWVGFDGGVSYLSWSSDNNYLAALGGSILLVAKRDVVPGEAPLLCSLPMSADAGSRFKSFLWGKNNILIASTDHFLYVFDVYATNDTVLKRCYPIESIPIEKEHYFVFSDHTRGEILLWGGANMRKIMIGSII